MNAVIRGPRTSLPSGPAGARSVLGATGLLLLAWAMLLGGCAGGLSGLGGKGEFQCAAPAGIPCMSVSGVSANERAGNLPLLRAAIDKPEPSAVAPLDRAGGGYVERPDPDAGASSRAPRPYGPGLLPPASATVPAAALGAIRSEPTLIRIWVAPWEDADGDLNDHSWVYLQIDPGRWLIEHNRERIRQAFRPQSAARLPPSLPAPAEAAAAAARSAALANAAQPAASIAKETRP